MENWFKKQKQLELCVLPQFTLTEEWFLITYRYTEDEGNGNPSDTLIQNRQKVAETILVCI